MDNQLVGFGHISDNNEELKGKSVARGNFGLNQGNITVFEFNPFAGKDKSEGEAIDVTFKVKDAEYRNRFFPITKVFVDNVEIDSSHPKYVETYNAEMNQLKGVITHIVKALGVTEKQIETALNAPINSFKDWATIMCSLPGDNFQTRPVDGFLEYEWQIGPKNDKTYLRLPKNMKGGRFLAPSTPGAEWVESITEDGTLLYLNKNNNNEEHVFTRDANYLEGPKGTQQFLKKEGDSNSPMGGSPEEATASSWGSLPKE